MYEYQRDINTHPDTRWPQTPHTSLKILYIDHAPTLNLLLSPIIPSSQSPFQPSGPLFYYLSNIFLEKDSVPFRIPNLLECFEIASGSFACEIKGVPAKIGSWKLGLWCGNARMWLRTCYHVHEWPAFGVSVFGVRRGADWLWLHILVNCWWSFLVEFSCLGVWYRSGAYG